MIQVSVKTPRFRAALKRSISPDMTAGDLADRVASECAYAGGDHTFCTEEGRTLDRDDRLTAYVAHKGKLTLVLR